MYRYKEKAGSREVEIKTVAQSALISRVSLDPVSVEEFSLTPLLP
jgi:hypothetical protein